VRDYLAGKRKEFSGVGGKSEGERLGKESKT